MSLKIFYEIEKKFLLKNDTWRNEVSEKYQITQGYLANISKKTIRVRKRIGSLTEHFLTIKVATDTMGKNIEIEKLITEIQYETLLSKHFNKINLLDSIVEEQGEDWEKLEFKKIKENITSEESAELDLSCTKIIRKIRYIIIRGDLKWEIDEFIDHNKGLIMAEVEIKKKKQKVEIPEWIGEEVTEDKRYYNNYLSVHKIVA